MPSFFKLDSPFYRAWALGADLVVVNILTLLACLPLITAGAALTACARVTMQMVREQDVYPVRTWWQALRRNFVASLAWWLPLLGAGVLALLAAVALLPAAAWSRLGLLAASGSGADALNYAGSAASAGAMRGLLGAGCLIALAWLVWLVPLVAFFENTVPRHCLNALRLAVGHLGHTGLCLLVLFLPLILGLVAPLRVFVVWFMCLLGLAFLGYLWALLQRKIIDDLCGRASEKSAPAREP